MLGLETLYCNVSVMSEQFRKIILGLIISERIWLFFQRSYLALYSSKTVTTFKERKKKGKGNVLFPFGIFHIPLVIQKELFFNILDQYISLIIVFILICVLLNYRAYSSMQFLHWKSNCTEEGGKHIQKNNYTDM